MTTALAWIWLPLVAFAVMLGVGLLAERAARLRLASALLAPLGFAAAVVLVAVCYELGLTRAVVLPLLALAAVAGLVLGRRGLSSRLRPGAPGLAALGAYALYLAPVALAGHWTWAGYNFTNDPSLTFLAVDWIVHNGATAPADLSSTTRIVAGQMVDNGYPLGSHLLLGTLTPLAAIAFEAAIQPFIALVIALGASAMAHLLRASGVPDRVAAVAALTASGAGLLYAYGQLGGLKEIATVTLLATAAAIAHASVTRNLRLAAVALTALVLAALVPVLSAGGLAYAGTLAVAIAALALVGPVRPAPRRLGGAVALGLAVFVVAAAVPLADALRFGETVSGGLAAAGGELGQLLRPLPIEQVAGIWFAEDWRLAVAPGIRQSVNLTLIVVVALLALLGIVLALRGRSGLVVPVLAAVAVAVVLSPRVSPYGDSKFLIVLTPFVLLLAAFGLWSLGRRGRRPAIAATVVGGLIVASVAYSDAIVYREVRLAPTERIAAIEDVSAAAAGRGLTLFNEWEEYAKYFARSAQVNVPGEIVGPRPLSLRVTQPVFGQHFDLDRQPLSYVLSHQAIITRRGPSTSRPPASFQRVHANRFYELWQRRDDLRVLAHLPAQETHAAQQRLRCSSIERFARSARRGETLLAHRRSDPPMLDILRAKRSAGWVAIGSIPETVAPQTPGEATQTVWMRGGRYRAWIRGSSGRAIVALVDDRPVGELRHVNTPGQWLDVGEVTVATGRHRLQLRRGGASLGLGSGSLSPGDGYQGVIGPLALEPLDGRDEYVRVSPDRASRLCGQPLDWVERVSGAVASRP